MSARVPRRLLPLALLLAAALAGCGGGGDSSASTATRAQLPATAPGQAEVKGPAADPSQPEAGKATFTPKPHHDSGGGSEQFVVKGADNSIQEFGAEGSEAELTAAATALHGFLDARAERNWAAACSYLSSDAAKSFAQLSPGPRQPHGGGCAAALAALSEGVPASTLAEAAQADVGSLRLEGEQAFLIYRGAHKAIYAISMAKEGGAWKVGSLSGVPLS